MIDTLKDKLKFSRMKAGLTQKKAAEILDVHPQSITKYEIGENKPSLDMLEKMAKLYNVGAGWLLEEENYQLDLTKSDDVDEIGDKSTKENVDFAMGEHVTRDLIKALKELNEARKDIAQLKEEIFELKKGNQSQRAVKSQRKSSR